MLSTLSAHFGAHLLAEGTQMAMAPTLYAIDQLPRTHAETYAMTHKLAQAAHKGTSVKPAPSRPRPRPSWPTPATCWWPWSRRWARRCSAGRSRRTSPTSSAERANALQQWREQAAPTIGRLLPGCGIELLLPEAYYVACREADKLIRPVSIRAAVHYLTNTLDVEPSTCAP
jgi:hypothetical protein